MIAINRSPETRHNRGSFSAAALTPSAQQALRMMSCKIPLTLASTASRAKGVVLGRPGPSSRAADMTPSSCTAVSPDPCTPHTPLSNGHTSKVGAAAKEVCMEARSGLCAVPAVPPSSYPNGTSTDAHLSCKDVRVEVSDRGVGARPVMRCEREGETSDLTADGDACTLRALHSTALDAAAPGLHPCTPAILHSSTSVS